MNLWTIHSVGEEFGLFVYVLYTISVKIGSAVLTLRQSRLYPPARDFGFGLRFDYMLSAVHAWRIKGSFQPSLSLQITQISYNSLLLRRQ